MNTDKAMSRQEKEMDLFLEEVYEKLTVAEAEYASGASTVSGEESIRMMREKYGLPRSNG